MANGRASGGTPPRPLLTWGTNQFIVDPGGSDANPQGRGYLTVTAALRTDLATPALPIRLGRINAPLTAHRAAVRAAQVAWATGDPNGSWIDTDSYTLPDNLHYDAAGQIALGQAFAA